MKTFLRSASELDAGKIALLVNRAYRPLPHERGWTHEADLVTGRRTTEEQVLSLFCSQSSILVAHQDAEIVACVHVKASECSAEIGMLAIDPGYQTKGLGKLMLECAERHAMEQFGATVFNISVLSSRLELIAFYERRAYIRTGQTMAYPVSAGVGEPMVDGLRVETMTKKMGAASRIIDNPPEPLPE
ncbi:MAG: GNAT family N-acetyltransferase [Azonexus sp.]|jgi:N-acetylglutamate synthase-like GNAT family acetyltransferase|nr:GNAT family N-acetyltransferase [Azonexus sp.]